MSAIFTGVPAELQRELDAVRGELARIDVKATTLVGWAGTIIAVLVAAAGVVRPPLPALAAVIVGGVLLTAAVADLLAGVIRPALPAPERAADGYGFARHAAAATVEDLIGGMCLNDNGKALRLGAELLQVSILTATKYRRLRRAVDLLLAALVLVVAALPLGALA